MRTLLELFKILKANKELLHTGLCRLCSYLAEGDIINYAESDKLKTYIQTHKPHEGSKYYNKCAKSTWYYWPEGKWYPRLLWINAQIKILKP